MTLHSKTLKFGDLLVKLGLINDSDMKDALLVAPQFGLPLGRTLVLSGRLTEEELQLAIELQALVNKKGYALDSAKEAAALVRNDNLSCADALQQVGIQSASEKATLGSLLLEAGIIDHKQLEHAQKISYDTGMRLGRVLILNGAISHNLLTRALAFQSKVRERKISIEQAVNLLRAQAPKQEARPIMLEAHDMKPSPAKKQVRFTEFLVSCGVATEAEILNAVETSLNKQKSLREAIIELNLISPMIFDRATELHMRVGAGELPLSEATNEIHKMVFGDPTAAAAAQDQKETLPVLGELLKMTGLVNDTDIQEAIDLSNKYPSLIGKMLVVSGAIDEAILIASLRCQYLLKHGFISLEEAIRALQYTSKNRVSFDDALDELGIHNPPAPSA